MSKDYLNALYISKDHIFFGLVKISYIIHVKCVTAFFSFLFLISLSFDEVLITFTFHSLRTKLSLTRWNADWRNATVLYEQAGS